MKVLLVGKRIKEELQKLNIPFSEVVVSNVRHVITEISIDEVLPKLKNFQLSGQTYCKIVEAELSILSPYGQIEF